MAAAESRSPLRIDITADDADLDAAGTADMLAAFKVSGAYAASCCSWPPPGQASITAERGVKRDAGGIIQSYPLAGSASTATLLLWTMIPITAGC